MIKTKDISTSQIQELTKLVDTAEPPIGKQLEYVNKSNPIGRNTSNIWDKNLMKLTPLGTFNNKLLMEWLENFTGIETKYLSNLHTNDMIEGGECRTHLDGGIIAVNYTVTFLLKEAEEGGLFTFKDRIKDYKSDKVLMFDGSRIHHGVTVIKKGTRKSLILFYYIPELEDNRPVI